MITRLFTYRHHNGLRAAVVALSCESEAAARTAEFVAAGESLALSVAASDVIDDGQIEHAAWYGTNYHPSRTPDPTITDGLEWLSVQLRECVTMEMAYRFWINRDGLREAVLCV